MYHNKESRARKKRKYGMGRFATETTIGSAKTKKVKAKGGSEKTKLVRAAKCNVLMNGKHVVCDVVTVKENPASRDFSRRNIITKGAKLSVKTPDGKNVDVVVSNRPGQEGSLNAVAAEKE